MSKIIKLQTPIVRVNLEECQECFGYGPHEIRLGTWLVSIDSATRSKICLEKKNLQKASDLSSNIKAEEVSELRAEDEDSRVLCSQ